MTLHPCPSFRRRRGVPAAPSTVGEGCALGLPGVHRTGPVQVAEQGDLRHVVDELEVARPDDGDERHLGGVAPGVLAVADGVELLAGHGSDAVAPAALSSCHSPGPNGRGETAWPRRRSDQAPGAGSHRYSSSVSGPSPVLGGSGAPFGRLAGEASPPRRAWAIWRAKSSWSSSTPRVGPRVGPMVFHVGSRRVTKPAQATDRAAAATPGALPSGTDTSCAARHGNGPGHPTTPPRPTATPTRAKPSRPVNAATTP